MLRRRARTCGEPVGAVMSTCMRVAIACFGGDRRIAPERKWQSEAIRGNQRQSEAIRGHQRPSEAIRGHQSAYRRIAPERHCSMLVRPPLSLGWSRRERVLWSKRERSSWCSVYLMREAIRGHQISSRGQRRHIQSALITSNQPSSHPISVTHPSVDGSAEIPSSTPRRAAVPN